MAKNQDELFDKLVEVARGAMNGRQGWFDKMREVLGEIDGVVTNSIGWKMQPRMIEISGVAHPDAAQITKGGKRIAEIYNLEDAKLFMAAPELLEVAGRDATMLSELLEAVGDLFKWFDSDGSPLHAPFIANDGRKQALIKLGNLCKRAKGTE